MSGGVGHLVLSGPLLLAVPLAAAAGAVTFLSPCVLPLVPGYLSYVTGMSGVDAQQPGPGPGRGQPKVAAEGAAAAGTGPGGGGVAVSQAVRQGAPRRPPRRRTIAGTVLFVLGFSAVYTSYGAAFGGLGSLVQSHAAGVTQVLGALTILLGLLFAGVFDRFPVAGRVVRPSVRPRAGLAGAPLLGVLFGVGWTPCVGPTLGLVLGLAASSGTAVRGAVLTFAYCAGLGVPFLVLALAFQRSLAAFGFARRHARVISLLGGAMLVAVGLLEVTGAWNGALTWLKIHWISNYQAPF